MSVEDSSGHCHLTSATIDGDSPAASSPSPSSSTINLTLILLHSEDINSRVDAAMVIRRLTKASQHYRRHFSVAIAPLVDMLRCFSAEANEAALAALLNLAVKDETNKLKIIEAGALELIIGFLHSEYIALQEQAVAALITLSALSIIKPIISASGGIPLLVDILEYVSSQAKLDAVMVLYNLSSHPDALNQILKTEPIPPLVSLLKYCKKSSRIAEKCTSLIESLMGFEEERAALTSEEGGILAVIEVLEGGSLQSREYAVGALLTMCQSNRAKYREPILREGVIPGLLELTVQGTPKSQPKAKMLLRLLRDTPNPRSDLKPDTLENIMCNIISQIEGEDQLGKAKQMLADMVQVSMEQSLRHLQKRALVCTPADLPINSCASDSEVPTKCSMRASL